MAEEVPEYYRSLVEDGADASGQNSTAGGDAEKTKASGASGTRGERAYRADAFRLTLPSDEWTDRSTYAITGPVLDEVTHGITVTTREVPQVDAVAPFAAQERAAFRSVFPDARVLVEDEVTLDDGRPAPQIILVRETDDQKLYQELLFVLCGDRGYVLSASFTRDTRKRVGGSVERVMRGFTPVPEWPSR